MQGDETVAATLEMLAWDFSPLTKGVDRLGLKWSAAQFNSRLLLWLC